MGLEALSPGFSVDGDFSINIEILTPNCANLMVPCLLYFLLAKLRDTNQPVSLFLPANESFVL